jgi:2-oxoglutarate ferredoxin oxidoreductase subunit delta
MSPTPGQPGQPQKKNKKKKKHPEVIESRCKGCGYCIRFCPNDVLAFSTRFNEKGYYIPVRMMPEACKGCGMCEMVCPDFSIFLVEDEQEAELLEASTQKKTEEK